MSMQRVRASGAVLSFVLVTAVAGCNADRTLSLGDEENPRNKPITNLQLSAPSFVSGAAGSAALLADLSAAATYTYVSASPGSAPGVAASIANRTRDRQSGGSSRLQVPLKDGGLDPIPVAAVAGDTLQIEFLAADRSVLLVGFSVVPKSRPPTIVRTNPRGGKKDVPLNARFEIVFSEPIDASTITGDNIAVLVGGATVAGVLVRTNDYTIEFLPAELLRPQTVHEIVIRTGVRNLSGIAIEAQFSASFETEPGVTLPPPASVCAGSVGCFAFYRDENIFTSTFDKVPEIPLLANATRPAWSADGLRIAFVRQIDPAGTSQICISQHDGTGVRCANVSRPVGTLSWAPEGAQVAFSVHPQYCEGYAPCRALPMGVRLLDVNTMQVTNVGTHRVQALAWSPDGSRIAYSAHGVGLRTNALYVMNADGSNVQHIGATMGGGYAVTGIAWSPDGGRLALRLDTDYDCGWFWCDTALGVVNANGTGLQILATEPMTSIADNMRYIHFPAWSPDGLRLAYTVSGCPLSHEGETKCGPSEIRAYDFRNGAVSLLVANAAGGAWRP